MAEIVPDEGLDVVLEIFPRGGANLTTTYLALFTSFTASTVGASNGVANDYVEPDFGSYARVAVAAADWGAIAAGSGGRKTTAAQKTFPTASSPASISLKGYWIANQLSAVGDKCLGATNFDDVTAVSITTNDIMKVTPVYQINN